MLRERMTWVNTEEGDKYHVDLIKLSSTTKTRNQHPQLQLLTSLVLFLGIMLDMKVFIVTE